MTNDRRVLVHPDSTALFGSVAARFITKTVDLLDDLGTANIVLTGGRAGTGVLSAINESSARDSVDWTRVHFWWGDERFVPAGDDQRNDVGARRALLDHIPVPEANIHPFAASDEVADLDAAVSQYTAELAAFATDENQVPRFDITFLGVGPDGHIASLFPDRPEVAVKDVPVVAVVDAPKPPPLRLSLTRPVLNGSDRIWLVLSGADKAAALGLGMAGASFHEVPVAGIKGRKRTVFFVDQDAAAEVPESLIAPSY